MGSTEIIREGRSGKKMGIGCLIVLGQPRPDLSPGVGGGSNSQLSVLPDAKKITKCGHACEKNNACIALISLSSIFL